MSFFPRLFPALLALALLLAAPCAARATGYASSSSTYVVGGATAVASLSTGTLTAVPAGATCLFSVSWAPGQTTAPALSDNASGNTYTEIDLENYAAQGDATATYIGKNIQNGPTVFTASFSPSAQYTQLSADCFTGLGSAPTVDGHIIVGTTVSSPTGANAISSGNFSSSSGDLLWGTFLNIGSHGTTGVGTTLPWVLGQTAPSDGGITEYILSGAGGTVAATAQAASSSDTAWIVGAVAVKPTASAGCTVHHFSLLHAGC